MESLGLKLIRFWQTKNFPENETLGPSAYTEIFSTNVLIQSQCDIGDWHLRPQSFCTQLKYFATTFYKCFYAVTIKILTLASETSTITVITVVYAYSTVVTVY